MLDGSDFPKQGVKSAGVARQYCGALGKIANCQAGVFLAQVGPRGRALVDKRLYLPEEWTGDGERCATVGVPANWREYQSKTELAMDMLECAQARGHLSAQWVAGDSAFGMSPTLREGLASAGMYYVLDVRPDMTVWPLAPTWTDPPYQVSRVNYICRLASISFAGSPPWPGRVAGQRWSGSWGRQTPG